MGKLCVGLEPPQLLENAKKKKRRLLLPMSYEENWFGKFQHELPYDAVVFNFCLYQKKTTATA